MGLKDAIAGSTVTSDPEMEAFERIIHISEPVVTVAIEAKLDFMISHYPGRMFITDVPIEEIAIL